MPKPIKDPKLTLAPRPVFLPPKGAGYMIVNGKKVYTGRNWGKMYKNKGGKISKYYKAGGNVLTCR